MMSQNRYRIPLLMVGLLIIFSVLYVFTRPEETASGVIQLTPTTGSLTILYDNYLYEGDCTTEWGYSCLIETPEMTILFDTGGDPAVFEHNIEVLDVDVSNIDCIVLSHEHWDHIGGLEIILSQRPGISVYVPGDFPYHVFSSIRSMGGNCVEAGNATKISNSIAVTDTLDGPPVEHALMIQTGDGVILVTGCSHPGVENLARNAIELTSEEIRLAIGGYHLGGANNSQLDALCDELDELGVRSVSATHCTGDDTIEFFRERYGDNFVESGAGFHLEF